MPNSSDETNRHLATNRSLWDGWAEINSKAPSYRVEEFRRGASALKPIELEEVGDVRGKSLLHLQCHFGLDTLSWARLGATVTGVDFSGRAIETAKALAIECGLEAQFIQCDLFDLPNHLDQRFDIVITSYGVLCWLPDLAPWGKLVAHYLKPGGRFHIVEFHPMANAFDAHGDSGAVELMHPYFRQDRPLCFHEHGSYADPAADFHHDSYEWPHSISDILNSLIAAGLRIEHFNEFPYSITSCFAGMTETAPRQWRLAEHDGRLPLMFSLKAVKM